MSAENRSNPVEQFVLLAKVAKGAAAVTLVKQALEANGVYVFGELLDMPNIQEVSGKYMGNYGMMHFSTQGILIPVLTNNLVFFKMPTFMTMIEDYAFIIPLLK